LNIPYRIKRDGGGGVAVGEVSEKREGQSEREGRKERVGGKRGLERERESKVE